MRVAVLAGGRTPERDVSLRSGHRVSHALVEGGHDAWLVDPGEVSLVEALQERAPDICYLTLHGKEGEDGTVQRLLDLLRDPVHGHRAVRLRGGVRQGAGEGRARARRRRDARLGRGRGVGAARPRRRRGAVDRSRTRRPAVRGEALALGIRPRRRASSSGHPTWPPRSWPRCRSPEPRSWKRRSRVRRWPSGSSARPARGAPAGRDRAEERRVRLRRPLHGRSHRVLRARAGLRGDREPACTSRRCGRSRGCICETWPGWTRSSTRGRRRGCSR